MELLEHLARGERSVERLAALASLLMASAPHHLKHLRAAGLLSSQRDRGFVLYHAAVESVPPLLEAERNLVEADRILGDCLFEREALEPVSPHGLPERMYHGLVTVLDGSRRTIWRPPRRRSPVSTRSTCDRTGG